MLLLSFNIGDEKYVINTRNIIEVTPVVRLKKLPGSIKGVSGLLNYHGSSVPVVDINLLCGKTEKIDTLATRIIIVKYHEKNILGIKAGNVTETRRIDVSEFKETGIQVNKNKFLGDIAEYDNKFLQLVNVEQLLTDDIRDCLFPKQSGAIG